MKFDIFDKVNVNGDDAHPLWKYLKSKQGGLLIEYVSMLITFIILAYNVQIFVWITKTKTNLLCDGS